jgi:hypothetical protein
LIIVDPFGWLFCRLVQQHNTLVTYSQYAAKWKRTECVLA